MQNKSVKDIGMFVIFLVLNTMTSLYLFREVNSFSLFYVFPEIVYVDPQLLLMIGVWMLPKLLLVSYFIKRLYEVYKVSYPYYYIRTKKPNTWLNRVLMKALLQVFMVCIARAFIFYIFSGMNTAILDVFSIVGVEFVILASFIMVSFTIYLLFENEGVYPICMAMFMGIYILCCVSGSLAIQNFMFYMQMNLMAVLLLSVLCIILYQVCVVSLRHKNIY